MIAAVRFTGVIRGREKVFRPGDSVKPAEAKELGLADKPHLVQTKTDKDE